MGKHKVTNMVEQLRKAVADSGQSLYAVAKGSGVDYSVLLRFMAAERGMTLDTAAKLAGYLGLELSRKGK
jgi:hypothetical protein